MSYNIPACLQLIGGTLTGDVTNNHRYLFTQSSFVTTMSQTGILATIVGMSSATAGAYVIPATGSPFTVASYQGTSTVPTTVSQTITAGTACTVYYYPNGAPLDGTGSGVQAPVGLFSGVRYLSLGGSSVSYMRLAAPTCAPSFSVSNGMPLVPSNPSNQSASQSGPTVTGIGTSWDSSYRGHIIRFAGGQVAWITAVGGTTSLTVTPSQSVSTTSFDIPGKTNGTEATSMDTAGNFGTNNAYINGTLNLANSTFAIAGNTAFTGAFTTSFTASANTTLALPSTSGTLALTSASATHSVYVDANAGNDTTGNGSAINPYATVTKALSVITAASITNTYAIFLQGTTTESVVIKPWVSIVGGGYLTSRITGNFTLDSTWGTATSPRANISNIGIIGNITFSISGAGTSPNLILSSCFVNGTSSFTGRSSGDFYQSYNTEFGNSVTSTDCLFQSYSNIYDGTVLYRNSAAPGSSFWQSSGDLFNGAFNVTAGTAQSITAFINNSRVAGGSTVTGATANITYDATAYATGNITLATSGTATPNLIPALAGGTGATNVATTGTLLRGNGTGFIPTTTTYPATDAINTIRFFSSANVAGNIATANNAALYTGATGIPAMTALGNSKILASNSSGVIAGRSLSVVIQVITATGTYTPTTGMQYVQIEIVAGGGGGGGCALTGASQFSGAAGGSGGECAVGIFSASTIGASQSVTIGAAGTAGTAGNNSGGNGGTTSVGALISAGGGFGGGGGGAQTTGSTVGGPSGGGVVNPGTGGSYRFSGATGGSGIVSPVANIINGGPGGVSRFSGGGGTTLNSAGFPAAGYGGGGSGASRTASSAAAAGGAGSAGVAIFTEIVIN